ncbi:MAG: hypothetical protein K9G59_13860 [Caulobacter sp.]|nr:hypothetical protein [Caulobacter sp.]
MPLDAEDQKKGGPEWRVELACDHASGTFRMADIPHLPIGTYEVQAVGGGPYPAWSNVRADTRSRLPWFHKVWIVTVEGMNANIKRLGSEEGYRSAAEALAAARPHRFEVGNNQIVILCIRDSGQDNRGGLRLRITPA